MNIIDRVASACVSRDKILGFVRMSFSFKAFLLHELSRRNTACGTTTSESVLSDHFSSSTRVGLER